MTSLLDDQTGTASVSPASEAWFGNAAKMRIIGEITEDPRTRTILDYGAGEGRGWAAVLALHPQLSLICYEPDPVRAAALRANVPTAQVLEGDAANLEVEADVLVSFSVFEHVYDRRAYLAQAWRCLKPGGRFYLNYDDGHFREPSSRAEWLRNRLAPVLPLVGQIHHFQARVIREEADRLVREAGFEILRIRYENLRSFKVLSKTIEASKRSEFARLWLDVEDRLNAEFGTTGSHFLGDNVNLWREMGSRTLELTRTGPAPA
jgi:SAM-dependent methyltransferase